MRLKSNAEAAEVCAEERRDRLYVSRKAHKRVCGGRIPRWTFSPV